jgi:drug/metabolite transporter (DMT)-like permease
MSWFILSLLSVTALAAAELIQQKLLNKTNPFNERASSVLTFLFEAILLVPFLLFTPYGKEFFSVFQPSVFPQLMAVTVLASIAMIFYLRSFKVKNISYSSIFGSISVVVSTTLGIMVFQEGTQLVKFLGILLILFAIIALNYKNVHLEKNHFYSLLSGMLFGICVTFDKSILQEISTPVYMFWVFLFGALFGFLARPMSVIRSVKGKSFGSYRLIAFSGICYFIFNLLTFSAYVVGGEVGKVDAINNTTVFWIILFEYFILTHAAAIKRKLAVAAVAYTGIVLLGFF